MKKCKLNDVVWESYGLTPAARLLVDKAMKHMLMAVEGLSPELAAVVFREALFQLYTLPTRTVEFQQEHRWIDPSSVK